jgi:hypothetical protein
LRHSFVDRLRMKKAALPFSTFFSVLTDRFVYLFPKECETRIGIYSQIYSRQIRFSLLTSGTNFHCFSRPWIKGECPFLSAFTPLYYDLLQTLPWPSCFFRFTRLTFDDSVLGKSDVGRPKAKLLLSTWRRNCIVRSESEFRGVSAKKEEPPSTLSSSLSKKINKNGRNTAKIVWSCQKRPKQD